MANITGRASCLMWSCGIFQVRQHCSHSEGENWGRYKIQREKSDKVENVIQSYREYPLYANYPRDIAPPWRLGCRGACWLVDHLAPACWLVDQLAPACWLADQLAPARIVAMNQKGQRHGPRPSPVCWLVTVWISRRSYLHKVEISQLFANLEAEPGSAAAGSAPQTISACFAQRIAPIP